MRKKTMPIYVMGEARWLTVILIQLTRLTKHVQQNKGNRATTTMPSEDTCRSVLKRMRRLTPVPFISADKGLLLFLPLLQPLCSFLHLKELRYEGGLHVNATQALQVNTYLLIPVGPECDPHENECLHHRPADHSRPNALQGQAPNRKKLLFLRASSSSLLKGSDFQGKSFIQM